MYCMEQSRDPLGWASQKTCCLVLCCVIKNCEKLKIGVVRDLLILGIWVTTVTHVSGMFSTEGFVQIHSQEVLKSRKPLKTLSRKDTKKHCKLHAKLTTKY